MCWAELHLYDLPTQCFVIAIVVTADDLFAVVNSQARPYFFNSLRSIVSLCNLSPGIHAFKSGAFQTKNLHQPPGGTIRQAHLRVSLLSLTGGATVIYRTVQGNLGTDFLYCRTFDICFFFLIFISGKQTIGALSKKL